MLLKRELERRSAIAIVRRDEYSGSRLGRSQGRCGKCGIRQYRLNDVPGLHASTSINS